MTSTFSMRPLKVWAVDQLEVRVYRSRREMGAAAAEAASDVLRKSITTTGAARVAFAAAPSQTEFLEALGNSPCIDWSKVIAFQLDEYIGLPSNAPQAFGRFLREHLFDRVKPGMVHYLDGNASDLEAERQRYTRLLAESPLDLACIGVGENGHIAFNEPGVADFFDPALVKVVELAFASRQQQVHDGCFSSIDEVPKRALTLTVPTIMAARRIVCVVPSARKAEAVSRMLLGPISPQCPASILRRHPGATLYLDLAAASRLAW